MSHLNEVVLYFHRLRQILQATLINIDMFEKKKKFLYI